MPAATAPADPPPGANVLADRLSRKTCREEDKRGPSLLLDTWERGRGREGERERGREGGGGEIVHV